MIGTPVAIAVYFGERGDAVLDALRAWLDLHGQAVVLDTLLVLGVWLVGKGLEGLLGKGTFCASGPESCPMARSGR